MTRTFALFNTGKSLEVIPHLYRPNALLKPGCGSFEIDGGSGFQIAANRASKTVYRELSLGKHSFKTFSAGFDLLEADEVNLVNFSGRSAGLAFSIALIKKLLNIENQVCGATGIIEANGRIATVNPRDVEAKFEGALKVLPPGSRLFFPEGHNLPPALEKKLKGLCIKPEPVRSIKQVLDILTQENRPLPAPSPESRKKAATGMTMGILILVLLLLSGFLYYHSSKTQDKQDKKVSIQTDQPSYPAEGTTPQMPSDEKQAGAIPPGKTETLEKEEQPLPGKTTDLPQPVKPQKEKPVLDKGFD